MADSGESVFNLPPERAAPLDAPGGKKKSGKTAPAKAPQSKGRKTIPGYGGPFPQMPPAGREN